MGLFSKRTATATASPDGSVPAEGKGFFGRAMRDAIGHLILEWVVLLKLKLLLI